MPISENINNNEQDKFSSNRGTRVRTQNLPDSGNSIEVEKTGISTTATRITTPENASVIRLRHDVAGTVYIGGSEDVTASTGYPMIENEALPLNLKLGDANEIYAITASGTGNMYAMGEVIV